MLVVIVIFIFPAGQNERELNQKTLTIESRLWSRPQEKMFVIDEVFVHFCRQNNCSVNISIVSDGQMLHRASIQKKTGKLTTDVVIAYAAYFSEWVANDYVLDITREIRGWQDRTFSPGINQMAVIDDRQYFALIASDVYLLCANKAALKYLSAGVDVQNLSWEQFSSWALAIARGEGVGKLAVTGVPGTAFIYQFAGIALSYGAGFPDVSSAGAIKAWELVITMKDALMPVIATCNNPVKPMLSGEAWLTWAHVANVGEIHSNAPARFIVAPVPYGPEGKGSIAGTQGIGIRKGISDPPRYNVENC